MSPQKILVVDDEAFIADMSRMALGDMGYEVFCAYSGEQAIEMTMINKFDLVIVDAMLTGMNGIETFDVIKANGSWNYRDTCIWTCQYGYGRNCNE